MLEAHAAFIWDGAADRPRCILPKRKPVGGQASQRVTCVPLYVPPVWPSSPADVLDLADSPAAEQITHVCSLASQSVNITAVLASVSHSWGVCFWLFCWFFFIVFYCFKCVFNLLPRVASIGSFCVRLKRRVPSARRLEYSILEKKKSNFNM